MRFFCIFFVLLYGVFISKAQKANHEIWDSLLKKHVSEKGFVSYTGLKKDEAQLKKYLEVLANNTPSEKWSKDDQLAYWINAYNAFTVQLILNHSDKNLKSIKDIGDKIKIPFVNTPWDIKFIKLGTETYDLNNIEHGIIRKKFDEPRIHFALVCAAKSCPKLRNEAFLGTKLNSQLEEQAIDFMNDGIKNQISVKKVGLSKILMWYKGDFTNKMPLVDWINKYSKTKITQDTPISYNEYYWNLNGK